MDCCLPVVERNIPGWQLHRGDFWCSRSSQEEVYPWRMNEIDAAYGEINLVRG